MRIDRFITIKTNFSKYFALNAPSSVSLKIMATIIADIVFEIIKAHKKIKGEITFLKISVFLLSKSE